MVLGSSPVAVTSPSDFAPASSKEFLDIQATIECGFTLKRVRDMTRTYNLDISIRNSYSCHIFTNLILKFIRPEPNRISSTQNFGLKLPTRMRLGLSHLSDYKFKHNFQDCLNPICSYGQEIETTSDFLLHCLNYRCARKNIFEKINLIDFNTLQQRDLSMIYFSVVRN